MVASMKDVLNSLVNAVENLQVEIAMLRATVEGKNARTTGELVAGRVRAGFETLRKQIDALPNP